MHSNEDDSWFITKRNGNAYDEVSVDKKHIYVVKRTYSQNKENPCLSVCITQICKKSRFIAKSISTILFSSI